MRISVQNLPKDLMGLTKQQGLVLRLGELLEAKVLKVGPEHALLNLKGQKILAEVRSELNVGDLVKVRVAGEVENKILLRILGDAAPRQNSVDQLLQNLGQKSEPETRSALAFLLKNQLPVSKETLQALLTDQKNPLAQLLEKLLGQSKEGAQQPADQAQTPAKAGTQQPSESRTQTLPQQLEKPTNPTSGNASLGEPSTSPKSSQATSGQTISSTPDNTRNNPVLDGTQNADQQKQVTEKNSTPSRSQSPAQVSEQNTEEPTTRLTKATPRTTQSQSVAFKGSTQLEQSQSPTTSKGVDTQQTMAGGKAPSPQGQQPLTQLLERLAEQRTGQSSMSQESSSGLLATEQGGANPKAQQALPNLGLGQNQQQPPALHQQLEDLGLALNPAKDAGQLVKQLKNLLHLMGLQSPETESEEKSSLSKRLSSLLNTPLTDDQKQTVSKLFEKVLGMKMRQKEDGTLLHLEIPVLFQQPTTAQLRIRDDAPKLSPKSKEAPLSILFQLETKALGEIKVMAVLQGQEIQCNFAAQREEVRKTIRRSLADLKGRFASMNYKVHQMQVIPWVEEVDEGETPLSGQVDFRV